MTTPRRLPASFLRALLIALLLAVAVGLPLPTRAAAMSVAQSGATEHFPQGFTFTLTADAPAGFKQVQLLYTTAGEETLNLALPPFSPGPHIQISYPLDLQTNYLPPGVDLTYHWRLTDSAGNVLETPPQSVLWEDTRFNWSSVHTSQVTVYTYAGDADFANYMLNMSQQTIDKLQPLYGVSHSRPIRIWVYNSTQDFAGSQAPNSETWIAGASYPGLYLVLAIIPDGNKSEAGRIIPHETSHQVLFQATQNPFNLTPTWLDEGLAVSNQLTGTAGMAATVQEAAAQGRLFSIRALNSAFPYDPNDATLAYAESLSIVTFINHHFGPAKMAALIAVYRQGVSYEQAIQEALGVTQAQLDQEWKASLGYKGDSGTSGGLASDRHGGSPIFGDGALGDLASGALIMAVVALLGVAGGLFALRRVRHPSSDLQ